MVEGLDSGLVHSLADELARLWTHEIDAHVR